MKQDYILLVESFSGGIALEMLKERDPYLKGVIFVASFASCPNKLMAKLAQYLPVRRLASWPLSSIAHRMLFLGKRAPNALIAEFTRVIKLVPANVIKQRLAQLCLLESPTTIHHIHCAYIQADEDRLVPPSKGMEFDKLFPNMELLTLKGPHFIMQANPEQSLHAIERAMKYIINAD